jgi:hypothetical protein
MSDNPETTENPRMFAALRLLEKVVPPTFYGREPYWRAPVRLAPEKVFIPGWTWSADYRELPEGEQPVTLDCNGAFMAALGSAPVAWGDLNNTGEMDAWELDPRRVLPGYYLIDAFHWPFDATIVSPLGNHTKLPAGARIWIAAPTLILLLELLQEGTIGGLTIHDSWTPKRVTNFRDWNARLKVARNKLLDNIAKADTPEDIAAAKERYKAFKEGYGAAFSMMLTGARCHTRRPDWAHQVYAQHAATSWRKAWRFSIGAPLLAMGNTDALTVLEADLKRAVLSAKPPIKLDPTGRQLGYYKVADPETTPATPTEAADFVMSDDFEDVL